jgi:hypothetical protein
MPFKGGGFARGPSTRNPQLASRRAAAGRYRPAVTVSMSSEENTQFKRERNCKSKACQSPDKCGYDFKGIAQFRVGNSQHG